MSNSFLLSLLCIDLLVPTVPTISCCCLSDQAGEVELLVGTPGSQPTLKFSDAESCFRGCSPACPV